MSALHVVVAGHVAGEDIRGYLDPGVEEIPHGYDGAPLMGVLIGQLLELGCRVTAVTSDATLPPHGGPVTLTGPAFSYVATPARRRAWRPNGRLPGRALDFFAFETQAIRQAIAAAKPDLVHVHWSYEFALGALRTELPTLITCHDSPRAVLSHARDAYRLVRYCMARRVFAKGMAFTAVSDYLANEIEPYLRERPTVVPNPVADYVLAERRAPRAGCSTRRVGMICNGWGRRKNGDTAIEAFAAWRGQEPAAELHLYGQDFGPGERAQCWADERGLSTGLHFHGALPHRQLVRALDGLDALLHPAREETFGVVLAEAMALGLPVVAGRRSGAVPDVMGADSSGSSAAGVLVDVESAQEMADALSRVFDNEYASRSAAGWDRARSHFAAAAVTQRYLTRYRALLEEVQK